MPRSIGRLGAKGCTILWQLAQESFGRTCRMTLKWLGIYSSISATSSPKGRSLPPQSGHAQGFSCTISSRGSSAGKGRRTGFSDGSFGGGRTSMGLAARLASRSSIESCICTSSRSSCSEERPYFIRLRYAISKRSFSSSSFWEISSASATSSLLLRSRMMPLRASTSFGRSAALGMRHYIKIESLKREKKPTNKGFLRCEMRLVRALDAPPIDPFQQHRELRGAQTHRPMRRLRPHEAPAFKTLGEETQSIPAPPQDLHSITRFATKHKQLSGERILRELRLHECGKSIEAVAQVGRACGEPHLHSGRQCNHRCTRRSMTRESASASTRPRTTML